MHASAPCSLALSLFWGGGAWPPARQVGTVAGGLCRLRVRGSKAHDVVQQVLRTAVSEGHIPPAGAVSFEDAARENAVHWQAMASCSTVRGSGGSGGAGDGQERSRGARSVVTTPLQLPTGSVLALTALDPRERPRSNSKVAASDTPSREVDSKIEHRSAFGAKNHVSERGGSDGKGKGGSRGGKQTGDGGNTAMDSEGRGNALASSFWNPRWAPVSPLWDPDARALSAKLAQARRDDVINGAHRKERSRTAWDAVATHPSAMLPALTTKASATAVDPPSSASCSAQGVSPVILISSSGKLTKAHEVAEEFERSGRGRGEKAVERKRRAVGAGWDLVLSAGWAPVFFHSLVMAGARALSIEDADWLKLETEDPW